MRSLLSPAKPGPPISSSSRKSLSPIAAARLFGTGATVGPVVDGLHNQCLLTYRVAPIVVDNPIVDAAVLDASGGLQQQHLLCSSWIVLPLLGVAYVVLGGVLPRLVERLTRLQPRGRREVPSAASTASDSDGVVDVRPAPPSSGEDVADRNQESTLRIRALAAVATTALIIRLSAFFQTHPAVFPPGAPTSADDLLLFGAAFLQWFWLDGTPSAFLAAGLASIGGPLSELPFVGHGVWEYLPSAAEYFPLRNSPSPDDSPWLNALLQNALVGGGVEHMDYHELALSSITGPCYFAVTMDAIALGRWFDPRSPPSEEVVVAAAVDDES